MNKIFFVTFFCFILSSSLYGQSFENFGIKAGINISTQSGSDADHASISGLHFGISTDFPISERMFITPSLLYSRKGYAFGGSEGKSKLLFDYLELPVHYKYQMNAGHGDVLLSGGVYIAYALNSLSKYQDMKENISNEVFGTGGYKRFDYGINIGSGYEYASFRFEVQYSLGIGNLVDSQELRLTNRVWSVSLSYIMAR